MARSKDLFDDSTMSFGEHLEALRGRLFKAIIGVTICTGAALFYGDALVAVVRAPIDQALAQYGVQADLVPESGERTFWQSFKSFLWGTSGTENSAKKKQLEADPKDKRLIVVEIDPEQLKGALASLGVESATPAPRTTPAPGGGDAASTTPQPESPNTAAAPPDDPGTSNSGSPTHVTTPAASPAPQKIQLTLSSRAFEKIERVADRQNQAITLTVQEAFMTYMKVAIVAGLIISSPWVFYQLWLFVASGLYPHERKYVYFYLPMSLALFLGGAAFCFYLVFPVMLKFLLGFNYMLHVQPQIRLSEWISFAILLPLMFGLSFQLPLVMLFLERVSIFEAQDYREKRRFAVLAIAVISMVMTPSPDPGSMLLMMFPLLFLYEFGIYLCGAARSKSPFGEPEAA